MFFYSCLGSTTFEEARVEADVADVVSLQQPAEEALQAQPVAAVRDRPELTLVRVPVVRGRVDTLALVTWTQIEHCYIVDYYFFSFVKA